jgi:hypothetical protein
MILDLCFGRHHGNRYRDLGLAILLVACVSNSSFAQEAGEGYKRPNTVELFVGGTIDDNDMDASIGAAYERRLSDPFGVGALVEVTVGGSRDWVVAVPFYWHPQEPWRLLVAGGIEHDDTGNVFLVRLGGSYEIEFDGWSLSPELNLDFVDGDVLTVLGVSFDWKF